MVTRKIPATGEEIPAIGLGSWIQFDTSDGSEKNKLSVVLNKFNDRGGRLIDSSPMYGKAERVIGELVSGMPFQDKLFYATKVWISGEENGIQQMNQSFDLMKRKTMDLIQVHNLVDYKTHLRTLQKWKEEGLVRYIGVSHYTVSAHQQIEEIIRRDKIDFVQFNYSIGTLDAEKSLLPLAADKGIAVIINEPLEKGALLSVFKQRTFPEWCSDLGIYSPAQFALKYILSHPAVTCVIPATSEPDHLEDNMAAGGGKLPDDHQRMEMLKYFKGLL